MNNYGLVCAALIIAAAVAVLHNAAVLGWVLIILAGAIYFHRIDIRERPTSGRRLEDLLHRKK